MNRWSFASAVVLVVPSPLFSQSTYGSCSPIAANNRGVVNITCANLTPEQIQALGKVPSLLNAILAKQLTEEETATVFGRFENELLSINRYVKDLNDRAPDPQRGMLIPGNEQEPVPPMLARCFVPPESFRAYLGTNVIASTFTKFLLRIKGEPVFSLSGDHSGIKVSATFSSSDGKRAGKIVDNYFKLEPDNYFRRSDPADRSTLEVFDDAGVSVFRVKFLNPHAIALSGTFQVQGSGYVIGRDPFVGEENSTPFPLQNACIVNNPGVGGLDIQ